VFLTPEQLRELRENLEALRSELTSTVADSAAATRPVSLDEPIGRLSRMDAMQQQSMAQANRRASIARLGQVDSALGRLERGVYGRCLGCDEDVAWARLKARPEAFLCIRCQREQELEG
jgi:DnaK suppressor protein